VLRPAVKAVTSRLIRLGPVAILVHPGFWDADACAMVRTAMDRGDQAAAEIHDRGYRVDRSVRDTLDIEVGAATIAAVEQALSAVRSSIGARFSMTLSGSEGSGFLRYTTGGFYLRHQDVLEPAGDNADARRLSVVLFLTGAIGAHGEQSTMTACEGGALRLHGLPGAEAARPVDVLPSAGTLVVFPSEVIHEVRPVTRGIRDVVVDWYY
jgi:predicted 2-oxoglutarate/Fe(II)-dependent dioxygenase YbiX